MNDVLQQGVQALAMANGATRDLAIFCAAALVYVMAVGWLLVALWCRERFTTSTVVRLVTLVVLSFLFAKLLKHVVADPRPYLVTHSQPLIKLSRDNGFPSDHVLMAAALTAGLWWIERRLLWLFALGTVLVALGRLGVGAHHTLDVVGSAAIVAVAAGIAGGLPLTGRWDAPLLRESRTVRRSRSAVRR